MTGHEDGMSEPDDVSDASSPSLDELTAVLDSLPSAGVVIAGRILEREIGAGKQGEVWSALELDSGRRVAVKVVFHEVAAKQEFRHFDELFTLVESIDHVNLVRHFGHGVAPQGRWIAQEFVPGGRTLRTWINDELTAPNLDVVWYDRCAHLMLGIARGVAQLHARGITHLDLKPGNILLTEADEPKVTDLGLARGSTGSGGGDVPTSFVGTAAYAAPEQYFAPDTVSVRSDVYALGVILYELCTLQPAVREKARGVGFARHLQRPIRSPDTFSDTPRDLARLAMWCLEFDQRDRCADAGVVTRKLESYVAGESITTPHFRAVRRNLRWVGEHRTVVVAAVALIATAGAWARFQIDHANRLGSFEQSLRVHETANDMAMRPECATLLRTIVESEIGSELPIFESTINARFTTIVGEVPTWGLARRLAEIDASLAWFESDGRAAWQEVANSLRLDPRFTGWYVEPEVDLVPLGNDPHSGLQVFWHRPSGARPALDSDGRVVMGPETGLVFVLTPPGQFTRGSDLDDPLARADWREVEELVQDWHKSAMLRDADEGAKSLEVGPYFFSMFEMTQEQWARLTGENPSGYVIGSTQKGHMGASVEISATHPVESVSVRDAEFVLARFGLELPPESIWEYVARAGSASRWWTGDSPDEVLRIGGVNCKDVAFARLMPSHALRGERVDVDDGHSLHGPVVAKFAPNPFGIHGLLGNVAEPCADVYSSRAHLFVEGDRPLMPGDDPAADRSTRVVRGGSFRSPLRECSSAERFFTRDDNTSVERGVRPARRPNARAD